MLQPGHGHGVALGAALAFLVRNLKGGIEQRRLYRALGGGWLRRCGWYVYALLLFGVEATLQTAHNLWRDGTLLRYLQPGFHPDRDPGQPAAATPAADWLRTHAADWRAVR